MSERNRISGYHSLIILDKKKRPKVKQKTCVKQSFQICIDPLHLSQKKNDRKIIEKTFSRQFFLFFVIIYMYSNIRMCSYLYNTTTTTLSYLFIHRSIYYLFFFVHMPWDCRHRKISKALFICNKFIQFLMCVWVGKGITDICFFLYYFFSLFFLLFFFSIHVYIYTHILVDIYLFIHCFFFFLLFFIIPEPISASCEHR